MQLNIQKVAEIGKKIFLVQKVAKCHEKPPRPLKKMRNAQFSQGERD